MAGLTQLHIVLVEKEDAKDHYQLEFFRAFNSKEMAIREAKSACKGFGRRTFVASTFAGFTQETTVTLKEVEIET